MLEKEYLGQILTCHPYFVTFVHHQEPEDTNLAGLAVELQPGAAESWFWNGDLYPEQKI